MNMLVAAEGVETALIAAGAVTITALFGFLGVLVQQGRIGKKVDRVYRHINSVEETLGPDGEPEHLTLRQAVETGFARNDDAHEMITGEVQKVKSVLRDHEGRIVRVEREVGLDG